MIKRVLVLDRDPNVRREACTAVEKIGHMFCTIDDSLIALKLLKEGSLKIDLIISEHELPDLTGLALLENVREFPRTTHIPFVLMSERWTISEDDNTLLERRCIDLDASFCRKPFPDFNKIVGRYLIPARVADDS